MSTTTKFYTRAGENLTAIYQITTNHKNPDGSFGVERTFGENPDIRVLDKGESITPVIEITEKDYDYYLETWNILINEVIHGKDEVQENEIGENTFLTKYVMMLDGVKIVGYSERNKNDLCDFILNADQFTIADENGDFKALVREKEIKKASFFFETI